MEDRTADDDTGLMLAPCEPDCACVLHIVQQALAEGTVVPSPPASATTITDEKDSTRVDSL